MSRSPVHKGTVSVAVTVDVDVDVEVEDILSQVADKYLRAECDYRGLFHNPDQVENSEKWRDFCNEMRDTYAAGDRLHFEVLLVRMLLMAGVPRLALPVKGKVSVA